MNKLLSTLGGRVFVAFLLILISGTLLQAVGKLSPEWIAFALALKGMLTYRSIQQDKLNGKGKGPAAP